MLFHLGFRVGGWFKEKKFNLNLLQAKYGGFFLGGGVGEGCGQWPQASKELTNQANALMHSQYGHQVSRSVPETARLKIKWRCEITHLYVPKSRRLHL